MPSNYDTQVLAAQKSLDVAKQSASKALGELDAVTARIFREMDRFKSSVDEELRRLYVSHARVQVDYSTQLDGEWKKLLLLNGSNGGSGGSGSGSKDSLRRSTSGGASSASKEAEMLMI